MTYSVKKCLIGSLESIYSQSQIKKLYNVAPSDITGLYCTIYFNLTRLVLFGVEMLLHYRIKLQYLVATMSNVIFVRFVLCYIGYLERVIL